jgi:hypothetical protein
VKIYANIPLGEKTIQDDSELLSSALTLYCALMTYVRADSLCTVGLTNYNN